MCEIQEVNRRAEVVALPIWMGMRLWDNQDFEEFMSQFHFNRGFASFPIQDLHDVDVRKMYGQAYLSGVKNLFSGIKNILGEADTKVAIFYLVNGRVAESNWFTVLKKLVANYSPEHPTYTIVIGGGFNDESVRRLASQKSPYSMYEIRAHELAAVYSYFDSDAPTAGMCRLMEMMNRIMGADLPGREFPNYDMEELHQLAWHVCRESFNASGVREGALPKYEIKDGRPVFNVRNL